MKDQRIRWRSRTECLWHDSEPREKSASLAGDAVPSGSTLMPLICAVRLPRFWRKAAPLPHRPLIHSLRDHLLGRRDGTLKPVRQLPFAFDRAWDAQAFAIFRDGAACDVDAFFAQDFDDAVVGEDFDGRFRVDEALDLVTHGLG